jgi:hypothetical protein
MTPFDQAQSLLRQFKGDTYLHGPGVLPQVGAVTASLGKRAVLVRDAFPGSTVFVQTINDALTAAKDPQLKMKLENMPVKLTAEMVDEYMGPILQAAKTGKLQLIKNVP